MMEFEPSPLPHVPGYEPLRLLGRGGMGDVYLARIVGDERTVALKLLLPPNPERRLEQTKRFERETDLVRDLDHPNLVPVLGHGATEGRHYFVMEYVEGRSLREVLTPGQPLETAQIRAIVRQVAEALAYLEVRGVVHRDLKPENILLQADGRVRVTDFGIAVTADDAGSLTRTDQLLGTPDYMAPEQRAHLTLDGRADQFALAVVAYEMLTGRRPIGHFKPASQLNRRLHRSVDAALARGLADDPDDRFASTRAFAEALDTALARSPTSHLGLLAAMAGIVVLGSAVGIWLATRPIPSRPSEPLTMAQTTRLETPKPPEPDEADRVERKRRRDELVQQAERFVARRLREEAIRCYSEALALTPNDPLLLTRRAHEYKLSRRPEQAANDLEAALRLDPNLTEARIGRGTLYMQENDYRRALVEFEAALTVEKDNALALANRGYCHRRLGDEAAGLRDLDRAIELDADCGVAYHYRGIIRNTRKEYEGALSDFRHSVRCTPDNPFAHSAIAAILAECPVERLREPSQAIVHARTACELSNYKEWRELRSLAAAHAAAGQLHEAVSWAEKALALAPVGRDRQSVQTRLDGYRKRLPTSEQPQP